MQARDPPQSWNDASSRILQKSEQNPSKSTVILVRGAKKTGKSTFARSILNHLIARFKRVAFIEADPGQTEFTPPGLVSLHVIESPVLGPPFAHQLRALRSHFIGSTTPQNVPSHYLAAMRALVEHYQADVQYPLDEDDEEGPEDSREDSTVPLIVNTMGWTKGLGLDILRQIEQMASPTHVVSIISTEFPPPADGNVPSNTFSLKSEVDCIEVEALTVPENHVSRYNAADWRSVSLLSYFRYLPPTYDLTALLSSCSEISSHQSSITSILNRNQVDALASRLSTPLLNAVPYTVSVREAINQIVLTGSSADDVVPSEVGRILNGAVVALVSCDPGSVDSADLQNNDFDLPYKQGAPSPDPQTSHCIGLALIRGVSPSLLPDSRIEQSSTVAGATLQLLTPIPLEVLASVTSMCLVKGDLELPVAGMVDFSSGDRGTGNDNIPYLQYSKNEAAGAQRRRVRRNLMRRAQL